MSSWPTGSTAAGAAAKGGVSIVGADGKPDPLVLSLLIVVIALAVGYVVIAIVYFVRQRRERRERTRGVKYFQTGAEFAPQAAAFESEKSQPFEAYGGSHERTTPYDAPAGGA